MVVSFTCQALKERKGENGKDADLMKSPGMTGSNNNKNQNNSKTSKGKLKTKCIC